MEYICLFKHISEDKYIIEKICSEEKNIKNHVLIAKLSCKDGDRVYRNIFDDYCRRYENSIEENFSYFVGDQEDMISVIFRNIYDEKIYQFSAFPEEI